MIKKLAVKQPRIVNFSSLFLPHDNPRRHITQQQPLSFAKVQEEKLKLKTLCHLFWSLDYFFSGKIFNKNTAIKNASKVFINSCIVDF